MAQVQAEQTDRHDVGNRNRQTLEADDDVRVDIHRRKLGVEGACREMQQMVHNESRHHRTAVIHGPRSERRVGIVLLGIADGTRVLVDPHQLDRGDNMGRHAQQKNGACHPEKLHVALEEGRILVEPIGAQENLEIAEEVAGDKAEEDRSSQSHYGLFEDRRFEEPESAAGPA